MGQRVTSSDGFALKVEGSGIRLCQLLRGMALPCRVRGKMGLGFALDGFAVQELEGVARKEIQAHYGRAEPCLTTAGRAESMSLDF